VLDKRADDAQLGMVGGDGLIEYRAPVAVTEFEARAHIAGIQAAPVLV
jgi:hypothetical protein